LFFWGAFLYVFLSPGRICQAQSETVIDPKQEYNVKVAYLYSFGRYVEWPAESFQDDGGVFVIGVLGDDPFHGALDRIAKAKKIQGRQIAVRRFESMDDYEPCHILFVSKTASAEQEAKAIRALQKTHVLLAGEVPGFAVRGGTINFYVARNTVRFEVNVQAAKQQQLVINAKLLSLAKIIKGS